MNSKVGCKYGKLLVLEEIGYKVTGKTKLKKLMFFKCLCDCGKVLDVRSSTLCTTKNGSKSCGCSRIETISKLFKTHGSTKTKEYRSWTAMKGRCYNKNNHKYKNYGGRGIKVCERWKNSFEYFIEDMGSRPPLKYSLDRIDNNGDYEPANCRWATILEQMNNQSTTLFYTAYGETKSLHDWYRSVSLPFSYRTLHRKLRKEGGDFEQILNKIV